MCTVSIVPDGAGFRLMSNRDERRDRAVAIQPRVSQFGGRSAIIPADPVSGGSWIGVNDAGLAAVLLNRHSLAASGGRAVATRGSIVPNALAADSLGAALQTVQALEATAFQPFRLVLVQDRRIAVAAGDGREIVTVQSTLSQPCMLTASSLGDVLVDSPRRRLFEALMDHVCGPLHGQLLFHHHQWLAARDVSVVMEREDAATVSRTIVEVAGRDIALDYESLIPRRRAERVELRPC